MPELYEVPGGNLVDGSLPPRQPGLTAGAPSSQACSGAVRPCTVGSTYLAVGLACPFVVRHHDSAVLFDLFCFDQLEKKNEENQTGDF